MVFSDEYLEYWGTVFISCRLLEQGMTFGEFLNDPWGCLKAMGFQSAPLSLACGYRPLLPRQVKVAQALWRHWKPGADGRGGATSTAEARLALAEAEDEL